MPKISVIVPVYKTEKTVERCLQSIIRQTFHDIEIIVVDDGSPDNAITIVGRLAEQDPRIKIIHQKNQGLGAARNTGIKNAEGSYIACVDSDDYIHEQMLEKMYNALIDNKADISICQADNVLYDKGEEIKSLGVYAIPGDKEIISGYKAVELQINYIIPILFNSVCFKLVKKELFIKNDIWFPEKFRYAEDTPTSVGLFLKANKVALVRENLYYYVRENVSLTSSYSLKKARDIYIDMNEIRDYIKHSNYKGSIDNFVLGMLFPMEKQIIWSEIRSNEEKEEKQELLSIIKKIRTKKEIKPDFSIRGIPFAQKCKILCAYFGKTRMFCRMVKLFKWIPFVKYMV